MVVRLTEVMHRRGLARLLLALLTVVAAVVGPVGAPPISASGGGGDAPPVTVSDFYPEENNLSDCLGLVERPGCGSESRGGWRQTLTFAVLVAGLGIIFWRIAVGVRNNRRD